MRAACLLVCMAVSVGPGAIARADESEALARAHFARGEELYVAGRPDQAIEEFEIARRYHASPAFDYDIGRCLEALGRKVEAIEAYQRFRAARAQGGPHDDVDARIAALRAQLGARRPYLGPGLLLAAALAIGAGSAGVYGSARHDYDLYLGSSACMPCSDEVIDSIGRRQLASQVLLGVAVGVAFADVIWFGVAAQRSARRER